MLLRPPPCQTPWGLGRCSKPLPFKPCEAYLCLHHCPVLTRLQTKPGHVPGGVQLQGGPRPTPLATSRLSPLLRLLFLSTRRPSEPTVTLFLPLCLLWLPRPLARWAHSLGTSLHVRMVPVFGSDFSSASHIEKKYIRGRLQTNSSRVEMFVNQGPVLWYTGVSHHPHKHPKWGACLAAPLSVNFLRRPLESN